MRAQVLGAAVLPVLLITACSNRANDLYTYYDDSTAVSTAPPTTVSPPAPVNVTTTTTTAAAAPTERLRAAALTAAELADEEVTRASATGVELPTCVQGGQVEAYRVDWRYPSGSRLHQEVAEGTADTVAALRAALDCRAVTLDGAAHTIAPGAQLAELDGVDDQLTWCAVGPDSALCALVLAQGDLVTAVAVEAATAQRARAAIARLAAPAATALARG